MGGNSWRKFTHQLRGTTITALLCSCALRWNTRACFLGVDLIFCHDSKVTPSNSPVVKTRPVLDPASCTRLVGTAAPMVWALCRFRDSLSESTPRTRASASTRPWFTGRFCKSEWFFRFVGLDHSRPVKKKSFFCFPKIEHLSFSSCFLEMSFTPHQKKERKVNCIFLPLEMNNYHKLLSVIKKLWNGWDPHLPFLPSPAPLSQAQERLNQQVVKGSLSLKGSLSACNIKLYLQNTYLTAK